MGFALAQACADAGADVLLVAGPVQQFIEPAYGELACGSVGKGRMEEPENIVAFLEDALV